jgi:hypothetical protein
MKPEKPRVQMPGLQRNRIPGGKAARAAGPQNLSGTIRSEDHDRANRRALRPQKKLYQSADWLHYMIM